MSAEQSPLLLSRSSEAAATVNSLPADSVTAAAGKAGTPPAALRISAEDAADGIDALDRPSAARSPLGFFLSLAIALAGAGVAVATLASALLAPYAGLGVLALLGSLAFGAYVVLARWEPAWWQRAGVIAVRVAEAARWWTELIPPRQATWWALAAVYGVALLTLVAQTVATVGVAAPAALAQQSALLGVTAVAVFAPLAWLGVWLLMVVLRWLHAPAAAASLGPAAAAWAWGGLFVAVSSFAGNGYLAPRFAGVATLAVVGLAFTVGAISALSRRRRSHQPLLSYEGAALAAGLAAGLAMLVVFVVLLATPGTPTLQTLPETVNQAPLAADPSLPGPYAVARWAYGSGEDRYRAAFGPDLAEEARTPRVNLSRVITLSGFRKEFWGFDASAVPLNGYVAYPSALLTEAPAPAPVVLIVHGNSEMTDFSDAGYDYLLEHWASWGYVAVSVDENFLNGNIFSAPVGPTDLEYSARALVLLEHALQWRRWNVTAGHPFAGRVLGKFVLAGHSRGGEAIVHAWQLVRLPALPSQGAYSLAAYTEIDITALIALAANDFDWLPAGRNAALSGVDYLTIQGSQDTDVMDFRGLAQYQRADSIPTIKAAIFLQGANHGQFNSDWGRYDQGAHGWYGWLRNLGDLLAPDLQHDLAKAYTLAFLAAVLPAPAIGTAAPNASSAEPYLDLLCHPEAAAVPAAVPATLRRIGRCERARAEAIARFDGDEDITTATWPGATVDMTGAARWHEERAFFRFPGQLPDQSTTALFVEVAVGTSAQLRIMLPATPAGTVFARNATVSLAIAEDPRSVLRRAPVTSACPVAVAFQVRGPANGGGGESATVPVPVAAPIFVQLWKTAAGLSPLQLTLATVEIALAAPLAALSDDDVAALRELVLIFASPATASASVSLVIDDIVLYRP